MRLAPGSLLRSDHPGGESRKNKKLGTSAELTTRCPRAMGLGKIPRFTRISHQSDAPTPVLRRFCRELRAIGAQSHHDHLSKGVRARNGIDSRRRASTVPKPTVRCSLPVTPLLRRLCPRLQSSEDLTATPTPHPNVPAELSQKVRT